MKMAYILASLAKERANLERAMVTACAVGDSRWARINRSTLELLDKKIDALYKCLPLETVQEAREITSAAI